MSTSQADQAVEEVRAFKRRDYYIERTFQAGPMVRAFRFEIREGGPLMEKFPVVHVRVVKRENGRWGTVVTQVAGVLKDDQYEALRDVLGLAERVSSELQQGVRELNHYLK